MAATTTNDDQQQFCLRWNNFQANITSQFEALRDDEDFTDVTIACEGQRFQAHKVVLSACSPYFKELFKTNPCSHPIIFMRDVEAQDIIALMEFMYAGEVNVAQAHLSTFLKTAESLKIRGLTDTEPKIVSGDAVDNDTAAAVILNSPAAITTNNTNNNNNSNKNKLVTSPPNNNNTTVTSSQDISASSSNNINSSPPPPKRHCKSNNNKDNIISHHDTLLSSDDKKPKVELPDYLSDVDDDDEKIVAKLFATATSATADIVTELPGGMEIIPQTTSSQHLFNVNDGTNHDLSLIQNSLRLRRRRRSSDHWLPFDLPSSHFDNISDDFPVRWDYRKDATIVGSGINKRNKLIKLGEGIEIYEDQLRSVKWSDYRKLTRGLATILFSPAELATCSVTGQRWSRAGSGERPVKPALDRSKVQAIISYVATRFPMIEISRIKQVLAYKCKENSTAFKMKAVRYYEDQQTT